MLYDVDHLKKKFFLFFPFFKHSILKHSKNLQNVEYSAETQFSSDNALFRLKNALFRYRKQRKNWSCESHIEPLVALALPRERLLPRDAAAFSKSPRSRCPRPRPRQPIAPWLNGSMREHPVVGCETDQTSEGSFSAVSKPIFATKYSFLGFFKIYRIHTPSHRSKFKTFANIQISEFFSQRW